MMREYLGIGKAITPPISMLPYQHCEHLRIKAVDDAILRGATAPSASHPQRDSFTLLASHLLSDIVQIIVHPAHRLFIIYIDMIPNRAQHYPYLEYNNALFAA